MNVITGEQNRDFAYGNIEFKDKPSYLYRMDFTPRGALIVIFKPFRLDTLENKVYFERYEYRTKSVDLEHNLEKLAKLTEIPTTATIKGAESLLEVVKHGKYYDVKNSNRICSRYGLVMNELNNIVETLLLSQGTRRMTFF